MHDRVKVTAKKPEARKSIASQAQKSNHNSSISSPIDQILSLQKTIGNQAVQRMMKSGAIQAKLRISQPRDIYEQEADRVAEQVMRMPELQVQRQAEEEEQEEELIQSKRLADQITPLVQRQVEPEEEEEETLQAKKIPGQILEVAPELESRIHSLKGGGQPLPEADRSFMERKFGVDFSDVRVHTDSDAARMNRKLNAEAFAYGRNIYFGAGKYSSGISSGKRLLAHELTHVVQQAGIVGKKKEMNPQQRSASLGLQLFPKEEKGVQILKKKLAVSCKDINKYWDALYSIIVSWLQNKQRATVIDPETAALSIVEEIKYKHRDVPLELNKTYKYRIEATLPYAEIYQAGFYVEIIYPKSPDIVTERKPPSEKPIEEAIIKPPIHEEVLKEAGGISSEAIEKTIEEADKSLEEVDDFLAKLGLAAQFIDDNEMFNKIKAIREKLKIVGDPLSMFVKAKETVERGLKFCYVIIETSKYDPGSKEALLGFIKMGKEAGALLKDLSKYMPPGLSHFCEALGEAVSMFPKFVNNIKRLGELRRPEEILRLQRIRERILQHHPDIIQYINMIKEIR